MNIRVKYMLLSVISLFAFLPAWSQISVGMRHTRYVYGEYCLKHHYSFKLEHSIYSEKLEMQQLRLYVGYKNEYGNLSYGTNAFYGSTYKGTFFTLGAHIYSRYTYRAIGLNAILAPIYDSNLGYSTCFEIEPFVALNREITLNVAYTTIPDYRKSEQRIRGSFVFKINDLSVTPAISIPISGNNKMKSARVLASFNYTFQAK